MKNHLAKILFGLVIFLFSVALAYFTANYLETNLFFDYWGTVAMIACIYLVIGIAIVLIFPISLGFLFAADVLILNLLINYYGDWADVLKLFTIGAVLLVLYIASMAWMGDKEEVQIQSMSAPQSNIPPQV